MVVRETLTQVEERGGTADARREEGKGIRSPFLLYC